MTWGKNPPIFNFEKIDRISALPNDILCEILSLLPTELAVSTCILSKKWEKIWKGIKNIDVDRTRDKLNLPCPAEFVEEVLSGLKDYVNIQTFRVNELNDDLSHYCYGWIEEVVKRNVYELDVNMSSWWMLPDTFFTCNTLTILKLFIGPYFEPIIPTSFCLPCLKSITLRLEFSNITFVEKLIRNSPALEDLLLTGHMRDYANYFFDIYAPNLRRLHIQLNLVVHKSVEKYFIIHAPRLVYLYIGATSFAKYIMKNVESLTEANINLYDDADLVSGFDDPYYCAFEFLREIRHVEHLRLGQYMLYVLSDAKDGPMHTFHKLTRLELAIQDYNGLDMLVDLLRCSPNLEVLTLQQDSDFPERICCFKKQLENSYWSKQKPLSLLHLKVIKLKIFQRHDYDLDLVEYLLTNAQVLEELSLHVPDLSLEEEATVCMKVLRFPRVSRKCRIEFFGDHLSKLKDKLIV